MLDVLCTGILTADVMAKPVEKIPEKGKLELVDRLSLFTGGCAVNAAIDLAKLGVSAGLAGKVGDDGFGRFLLQELVRQKVDTRAVKVGRESATSASVVISSRDGERSFWHCLGANAEFCGEDVPEQVIREARLVFVAGTLLMPGFDGENCAAYLKKCKELGKTTALDTAWDPQGRWMQALAPALPYVDYFLPSYEEAVRLSGETELKSISEAFLSRGPHVVVIKNGKKGCWIQTREGKTWEIPTFSRIKAVDTNGAGDSFCAGFLAALIKGKSLDECGNFANAVGTLCVTRAGASTGIRSWEETLRFIREYQAEL